MKVWIDGEFFDKADARISVFDHGLLYGDGVFEGIRVYGGKAFMLTDHIDRLFKSAEAIALAIPTGREEMEEAVRTTIGVNEKTDGYIRLLVTRGVGDLGVDPAKCPRASVIIIVADITLYPAEYYEKGIKLVTASVRRIPPDCLDPRIKSLNYLNNILAKLEAGRAGCQEAVMLSQKGFVTECTGDNIFIVRDSRILTPPSWCGALDGITRKVVARLATTLSIPCQETMLAQYDLYTADECFLTGTGAEVVPVVEIDGRKTGDGKPGKVTRRLVNAFSEYVRETGSR